SDSLSKLTCPLPSYYPLLPGRMRLFHKFRTDALVSLHFRLQEGEFQGHDSHRVGPSPKYLNLPILASVRRNPEKWRKNSKSHVRKFVGISITGMASLQTPSRCLPSVPWRPGSLERPALRRRHRRELSSPRTPTPQQGEGPCAPNARLLPCLPRG